MRAASAISSGRPAVADQADSAAGGGGPSRFGALPVREGQVGGLELAEALERQLDGPRAPPGEGRTPPRAPARTLERLAAEVLGVVDGDRERLPVARASASASARAARSAEIGSVAPARIAGSSPAAPGRRSVDRGRRASRRAGPGRRRRACSAPRRPRRRAAPARPRAPRSCPRRRAPRSARARARSPPRAAGRAAAGRAASRRALPAPPNPNPRRCCAVDLLEQMARAPGARTGAGRARRRAGRARGRRRRARRAARASSRTSSTSSSRATPSRSRAARRSGSGGEVVVHDRFGTATVRSRGGDVRRRDRAHGDLRARRARCPTCGPARRSSRTWRGATSRSTRSRCGSPTARWPSGRAPQEDLRAGVLRVLHERSFEDDPTRLLRMARYAARLGFEPDPATDALGRRGHRGDGLGRAGWAPSCGCCCASPSPRRCWRSSATGSAAPSCTRPSAPTPA